MSCSYDAVDTYFLSKFDSHGVDALCKGSLQWHGVAGEVAVGIGGCPCYLLAVVHHLHGKVGVDTAVAWGQSLVHGFGIDEELEGGTGLAHGRYLIIFPRAEINVAHPCFDMTGLRFHSHESAMHEVFHVADAVEGRYFFFDGALLVVKELDTMRLVEVVVDGVSVAVVLLREVFVDWQLLGQVLDEVGNLHMTLILPGIGVTPVGIEVALYLLHLFDGCSLGILLHASVDSGIDFQTVLV